MLKWILLALGLVLTVEGVLYALFPTALKNTLTQLGALSEDKLRLVGLVALLIGVALVWLAQAFGR